MVRRWEEVVKRLPNVMGKSVKERELIADSGFSATEKSQKVLKGGFLASEESQQC